MIFYKTYKLSHDLDWVVLIHGAGGSSSIWFKQIKEYKKHFNVLLVDLRGHGKSKGVYADKKYSFKKISEDVLEVMDHLKIKSAHFVGISLGTLVIYSISEMNAARMKSMVLAGAIVQLTFQSKFLITLGDLFKRIIPYMWLYKLLAWIIMPKESHKKSRSLFIREARNLCQKEFIRWFKLAKDVNFVHLRAKKKGLGVPIIYIMGKDDYMFLEPVKTVVTKEGQGELAVIENCGHVCNIDQPEEFNEISLSFLKKNSNKKGK